MVQRNLSLPVLAALALAACQQPADDSNIAIDNGVTQEVAEAGAETLPPTDNGGDPNDAAAALNDADDAGSQLPSPPGTQEAGMIPDQYRGRWGITAADCDQSRSDAKGAITIGERSMMFYESRALLRERRPAIATSFSGLFAFTGEGQQWQKVVTLTRTGDVLRRADDDGSTTYQRCPAKEPS
jgi:hypothetical protein